MEGTSGDRKISIATLHLEGSALHWHKRFMRDFVGRANISWEVYCEHLRNRFVSRHEELKNLRQAGGIREYKDAFDALLTRVGQLLDDIMMGVYVGGLFPDIRAWVRAMRPEDLYEAQQFARLQEDVSRNPRRTHGGSTEARFRVNL